MTTQREKLRKLRALASSPNKHEAALALAKAQELEHKIQNSGAKGVARAIAQVLEARGMKVCVSRHRREARLKSKPNVDVELRYFYSQSRYSKYRIEIVITEYERHQ